MAFETYAILAWYQAGVLVVLVVSALVLVLSIHALTSFGTSALGSRRSRPQRRGTDLHRHHRAAPGGRSHEVNDQPSPAETIRTLADSTEADPRSLRWTRQQWLDHLREYADALEKSPPRHHQARDPLAEIEEHVEGLARLSTDYQAMGSQRDGRVVLSQVDDHARQMALILADDGGLDLAELKTHVKALDRLTRDHGTLRGTRAGDQLLEDVGSRVRSLLGLLADVDRPVLTPVSLEQMVGVGRP